MAISLKELNDRLNYKFEVTTSKNFSDSQGDKFGIRFGTNNGFQIVMNSGYVYEPRQLQEITYAIPLNANERVVYIGVEPYYNDGEVIPNFITWVRYKSQNGFTFGFAQDLENAGSKAYFLAIALTIYYIVRYNIYKLVRFLSHLNTKFGGERR